ncbi:MAG: hypothetical protein ACRC5A_16450 [Enterobacteriaceae bacterium]
MQHSIALSNSFDYLDQMAGKVIDSDKVNTLKNVGRVMHSMLAERNIVAVDSNLYSIVDDEDGETSYFFELLTPELSPEECGKMGTELVHNLCVAGYPEFSVIGAFVNEFTTSEGEQDGGYTP